MTARRWGLAAAVFAAAALLAMCLTRESSAIRAQGVSGEDRKRFGLNHFGPRPRRGPAARATRAFAAFNAAQGGRWKIRFSPRTGAPEALSEGAAAASGAAPPEAAASFLRETAEMTQVEPSDLREERRSRGSGMSHILYRQTYQGLPVEFAKVKVHLQDDGRVIGFNSSYEPGLALGVAPSLTSPQAFESVRREVGLSVSAPGELVILPDELSGRARLAWKFTLRRKWNLWRYFVDAHTGQVLLRYDDFRHQVPCLTSGTVMALVPTIHPHVTAPSLQPLRHQRVYVKDGSNAAVTDANGTFCSDAKGKIATSLQGPYVHVSNFRGPSAHYDNGGGVWSTVATPVSSPHPYPNDARLTQTVSLDVVAPLAVKVLPVFTTLNVGTWTLFEGVGQPDDNDQVQILDSTGNVVGTYIGNLGAFRPAAVHGRRYSIRLISNKAGVTHGYDVSVSSYLTLTDPGEWNVNGSSVTWIASSHTQVGLGGEMTLFYHLNKMHDYLMSDVNKSSHAYIDRPVAAMAYVGPDHLGAYYDPEFDNLAFGDIESLSPKIGATDDGTVSRHEYMHFVAEKIFPIQNFGQAGAVSEAMADYFAASSLNYTAIGKFFNATLGVNSPLRELDCPAFPNPACKKLTATNWAGQIHDDSIYLSQSLWDIRKKVASNLLPAAPAQAQSCADGLVFQTLLFFPESFSEVYDAIRRVDQVGSVAACPGANSVASIISTAFSDHGLPIPKGDSFEYNDGFLTAVDITTVNPVTATIYPQADVDFYTFTAGGGNIAVRLELPESGPFYKAYAFYLYDRQHTLLAQGIPVLDGLNTIDGVVCEAFDCNTTQRFVDVVFTTANAQQYFLQVIGPPANGFSNSGVNSTLPYTLTVNYPRRGAVDTTVVSAALDRDLFSFKVHVTSFPRVQPYHFAYAQLRDHAETVIPNTRAVPGSAASTFLSWISSHSALSRITGTARLIEGFGKRFPAVGTVHLEVFGYSVWGSTISLGLSQPINLATNDSKLTVFNGVFNPLKGQKTTIKYELPRAGRVVLKLYSMSGSLIATLYEGEAPAGKGTLDWAGSNVAGKTVASGVYVLHMESLGLSKTQKIVVVK